MIDSTIYKNKKFSDLIEEIHSNQKKKKKTVEDLIKKLMTQLEDEDGNLVAILPMVKEYLEVGVKNDNILVSLANTIQKILEKQKGNDSMDDIYKDMTQDEIDNVISLSKKVEDIKIPKAN